MKEYLLENWALLLIMTAFLIMLKTTIFLKRKMVVRMYVLIASVVMLSIVVFEEFHLNSSEIPREVKTVLTAVRYSATPVIMAMVMFTLVRKVGWYVFLPAVAFALVNLISIFNGVVFCIDEGGELRRGVLGYLPYIAVGLYSVAFVYMMFRDCNKQSSEIIPIVFMALAFGSGLVLPFALGKEYSKIFCTTIMIALFVYYDFVIFQLTGKDALTGLLNRQAYYAEIDKNMKNITGVVSIDMNGLKAINDNEGHTAGDEALETLAGCFMRARRMRQSVYRIGGDEFVILCLRSSKDEIEGLIERIKKGVSETKYSCSFGYSWCGDGSKTIDDMVRESDEMMYEDKAEHYRRCGIDK